MASSPRPTPPGPRPLPRSLALSVAALGVVYGDIGTSPLYSIKECFAPGHGVAATHANVLGVVSLVFWTLTLIVSLKYVTYVMRADNHGEGGILALMALAIPGSSSLSRRGLLPLLGLTGCALLYGDGMITPAVSVLSAVEGLSVVSPRFEPLIIPLTVGVLVAVFSVQRFGSARVGSVFGPIMVLWFVVLGVLGLLSIVQSPEVLAAVNPLYAVRYFLHNGLPGVVVLGAVLLCVTGAEALYADMGHFGLGPIRGNWFALVMPALLLNYLGQGALLLREPSAASNPFFRLAPSGLLYPMVALATLATVIASQALISGVFSLTRQAAMLGYWPRTRIEHTSADQIGQIYIPLLNWALMCCTIGLVLGFGNSSNLAAAYGVAVILTMLLTTLLAYQVARHRWRWRRSLALLVTLPLLALELSFLGASVPKFIHGGWFPLLVAAIILVMMLTWKDGRALVGQRIQASIVPLADFYEVLRVERPLRVPGTAVFMCSNAAGTPPSLMHNFLHNRVVHARVVLLTVKTEEDAYVAEAERVTVEELEQGFVRVVARFGYMENPDVPGLLKRAAIPGIDPEEITYFLGRETLLPHGKQHGLSAWRERLFVVMSRNAENATTFFQLPPHRVLEVGAQIEL